MPVWHCTLVEMLWWWRNEGIVWGRIRQKNKKLRIEGGARERIWQENQKTQKSCLKMFFFLRQLRLYLRESCLASKLLSSSEQYGVEEQKISAWFTIVRIKSNEFFHQIFFFIFFALRIRKGFRSMKSFSSRYILIHNESQEWSIFQKF